MTYEKLMQLLDRLPVNDPITSFISLTFAIISIVFALFVFFTLDIIFIPSLDETEEEKERYRNTRYTIRLKQRFKEKTPALNVFGVGAIIFFLISWVSNNNLGLNLEEKKKTQNTTISAWEKGKDFKSYLETLPTKRVLINDKNMVTSTDGEVYLPITYEDKVKDVYI